MIYNRDGIVGHWKPLDDAPDPLELNDPNNLKRWAPEVRAHIIDFEIHSRLGFTRGHASGSTMFAWHLEVTPVDGVDLPEVNYKPLVDMRSPTAKIFKNQLRFLDGYADLRTDRTPEILAQLGGPDAFLTSVPFLHPDRTPWTFELITAALRMAIFVEMRFKHGLACRRPHEFSPQVQPIILTPAHGTLPSGHSTEAFTSALVLSTLLHESGSKHYKDPSWGKQLMRQAARIAINRTVAGVHFPVDSAAGAVLGLTLGQYLVNRCTGKAKYVPWSFDGEKYPAPNEEDEPVQFGDGDFYWDALYKVADRSQIKTDYAIPGEEVTISTDPEHQSPLLKELWTKAKAEWF